MPGTINGIGTHYYGKKNIERLRAACEHCGRFGELLSYDARLWVVVLFIPIIPLGKKRIVDYCPHCTRHYPMALREWDHMKQESIAEGMSAMRANPDDPEAAMELHASLARFEKLNEALDLARIMETRFNDNAKVQLHLGSWYESQGKDEAADVRFLRALEIDPENPVARRAVAISCIENGELARARELLSCMEKPGPHQDPSPLFLLAAGYQNQGQHENALAVFQGLRPLRWKKMGILWPELCPQVFFRR